MKTLAAAFLFSTLLLPAATHTETRQEALAMGSKLWVKQTDGNLKVQGWDKAEVSIVAEFHDGSSHSQATLEVRRVAAGLEIEVKQPKGHHFFFGPHHSAVCHLTLMVPRQLSMSAHSVDGQIEVKNLDGYADLHTVDGNIQVQDLSGEVHVSAVDGNIEAHHLNARLKGGTVDGRITLDQVAGGVDLRTVDGSISAKDLDGWGEGITLNTVDGSIHVALGQAKGNLEAKATDGSIHLGNPAVVVDETRKHALRGHIAGRDQSIRLHSVDGSIHID